MHRWMGLFLGAGLLAAPGLASAASLDLFYERTVMVAADARCGLFTPGIRSALAAAQAQARGASLRAGADKSTLTSVEQRAWAKAQAAQCKSKDITLAAGRVRKAFEGYAKLIRMDYPGDLTTWRADRSSSVSAVRWRLAQEVTQGPDRMIFGLAGRENANAMMAVVRFEASGAPYSARLVMRDERITSGPYLNARGEAPRAVPLSRRLAPDCAQIGFQAEARSRAGVDLLPKAMPAGWAFRFPPEAAQAISALDPRESLAVDFLFRNGASRRVYVEVGDFAAGRAFLQVATR